MPRPLRSSCDRCHSQKLKCPKQSGSAACARCLKAGTACVFSQSRQPGPAAQRTPAAPVYEGGVAYQPPPSEERPDVHLSWPIFDLGDVFTNSPELSRGIQQDQPPEVGTPESPRANCVRQLTTLAVEVDQISVDLPTASTLHAPNDYTAEEVYALFAQEVFHSLPQCLEQLFGVSQRLIDLYQDITHQLFDQPDVPEPTECHNPDCIHTIDIPGELGRIFCAPDDPGEKVDVFLFNLVAACHSKVVDGIKSILENSKRCATLALTSPGAHEPRINLPELRVGNFVVSSTSASSMQAVLLVHTLSRLLDQAQQLRKGVEKAFLGADRSDKASRMLLLQCELLEEKTRLQVDQFNRVRDGLEKLGFIK
ncbi:hypothetical protein F5X99DRAFT_407949 [Biscogniauxia marginata]|nr:hypothetical protein F5X99DRAFT_407949 [Biscogniauxia marginata]